MSPPLQALRQREVLSDLDVAFARGVARLVGERRDEVILAAALASRAVGQGHVCLDLARLAAGGPMVDPAGEPVELGSWPALTDWEAWLRESQLVMGADSAAAPAPLVLDAAHRLYLHRYWRYEQILADAIAARVGDDDPRADPARLTESLARLFPADAARPGPDLQRVAACTAALRRFCVISGGPGTGKTYTVVRILALLAEQARAQGLPPPRALLLAPTGKAAARLKESIVEGKRTLDCEAEIAAAIPEQAATIHRALGAMPGRAGAFRHHRDNPLRADVVLVDEASMVDLALMARLADALAPMARTVLLGDQDQLASVEAGAVLGDICNTGEPRSRSRSFAARVAAASGQSLPLAADVPARTGIWDGIVQLTHSHRYQAGGGIGRLARAINGGDTEEALAALDESADLEWIDGTDGERLDPLVEQRVVEGFAAYAAAADTAGRLTALEEFRVLCAHRRGPTGVELVNQQIEQALAARGHLRLDGVWYVGRPILVTRNDYQLRLFNGDVGVIAAVTGVADRRVAVFPDGDGLRELSPSRLPPHETVFAMSVHKSQGSEFGSVALLLPARPSPVVSRELLYTAVTRARQRVVVVGPRAVFRHAVEHRVQRASGLRDRLWARRGSGVS